MRHKPFSFDASVLIDYTEAGPQVLALAARFIGPLWVVRPLLREAVQLDEKGCDELDLEVIDPSFKQLVKAASLGGALSFEDWLCLIRDRDGGYICATNDRRLRTEGTAVGVDLLWGLELMTELVRKGELQPGEAIRVAGTLQKSNPAHITPAVVERFERRVLGEM